MIWFYTFAFDIILSIDCHFALVQFWYFDQIKTLNWAYTDRLFLIYLKGSSIYSTISMLGGAPLLGTLSGDNREISPNISLDTKALHDNAKWIREKRKWIMDNGYYYNM